MAKNTLLSRQEAAKLLTVSVRTLDRYINKNALSAVRKNGGVYLDKKEIAGFKKGDGARKHDKRVNRLTATRRRKGSEGQVSKSTEMVKREDLYKELYQGIRGELKENQKRLEVANYRVGQLEAKLENTVPLLSHSNLLEEQKKQEGNLNEDIKQKDEVISDMQQEIGSERYNKMLYAVLLIGVLVVQPILWILLKG